MKNKICDKLISLLLVLILVVVSMGYTVLYSFAGDILADGVHSFYVGRIKPKSVIAEFNEDFSELTVFVTSAKSDGYMKDWTSPDSENYTYNPVYEHRDTLTKVIITDGVANTGDFLCYDCSQLKSVVLPKSIVRIGNSSFRKTGVTAISFPSKLVYIGERAFSGCHSLNGDLIIPDSVKAIGDYAFFNCYSLSGRLILGSSVKSLGRFAFDRCFKLSGELKLPSSLERIGAYCFENCEKLSGELVLNEGLLHIGDGAFNHCKSFTNTALIIPSTLKTIGGDTAYEVNAFSAMPVDAPEELLNHSSHVFYDFANETLSEFLIEQGNTGFICADGVLYTSDMKRLIAYPPSKEGDSYVIPEGVEIIDELAFGRLSYGKAQNPLRTITLPDSYIIRFEDDYENSLNRVAMCSISSAIYYYSTVTDILVKPTNQNYLSINGCLYTADGRELLCVPSGKRGTVELPDGVNSVANGAFGGCRQLDYIVIPDSVADINNTVFAECPNAQVICYRNSAAEELCSSLSRKYLVFGDVNNDGEIQLEDYALVKSYVSGFISDFNAPYSILADCVRDSGIDAFDLYWIDKEINTQNSV